MSDYPLQLHREARVARARTLYADWFRLGKGEAPKYQDYVQKQKDKGKAVLEEDEWAAQVLGVKPEEEKAEGEKAKGEEKAEKEEGKAEADEPSHSLTLPTPNDEEIKSISERAKGMLDQAKTGAGKAILGWLADRDAKKVKKQEQKAIAKALKDFDKKAKEQEKQVEKELKKLKDQAAKEDAPKDEKAQKKEQKKKEREEIKKKHGWFGLVKDVLTDNIVVNSIGPRALRLSLFGEESVKKAQEKKIKKSQRKKFKEELAGLQDMSKFMQSALKEAGFGALGGEVLKVMMAHALFSTMKNMGQIAGGVSGQTPDDTTVARNAISAAVAQTVNPPAEVLESAMEDIESDEPVKPSKGQAKVQKGYDAYVARKEADGASPDEILSKEDWEDIIGAKDGEMPDWSAEEKEEAEEAVEEAETKKKKACALVRKWAAEGGAESYFFDAPEKHEVRQFFESGALSNLRPSERQQGAPPTPVVTRDTTPGGKHFRTLSRHIVKTEHPLEDAWKRGMRQAKERSDEEKAEIFREWKELINMSESELEAWAKDPDRLEASINREEAKEQGGIGSGYDSLHRIKRRITKKKEDWTSEDYDNAAKENSFNSRMLGNDPGEPQGDTGRSKWEISLRNWGHSPSKSSSPGNAKYKAWKKKHKKSEKKSSALESAWFNVG